MIYIVEDDENIGQMESYALKNSGYSVMLCEDGAELISLCRRELPKLIILDIMLPGEDGLTILKRLRSRQDTAKIPVIIVSAKSSELDAVRGLDSGADDYISKPFGVMELISRVKAVLRRVESMPVGKRLSLGGVTIDDERRRVYVNDVPCELTFKEYELLKVLMSNHGIALSRDRLMMLVWETDFSGESRVVDMHIKSLRKKLGECGYMIKTIRSVGYRMDTDEA